MAKPTVVQGDLTEELATALSTAPELAIDCEMMGLNPFRDRLCLVQIAADGGPSAIVQVDEKAGAPRLKSILESESSVKIFHYARMDSLFLRLRLNIEVHNAFCTKIASRLARTYTDRHSLKDLVREFTGENMDKTLQSSDWGKEKLTGEQIAYAEGDVKHLFRIRRELIDILVRENRYEMARKVLEFLPVRLQLDVLGYEDIFSF